MRIGLDVTPLSVPLTGIGVFASQLARAVHDDPSTVLVPIALSGRSRNVIADRLPAGVRLGRSYPAGLLHRLWKRLDHPTAGQLFGKTDLVHGTNFYGIPPGKGTAELISIHDAGPWQRPADVAPAVRSFPVLAERAIERGAHVHALSRAAADELIDLLGLEPDRVHPIHLGFDPPVEDPDKPPEFATLAGTRYALAVGTLEPRKRFAELIKSFEPLLADNPDLSLVIAGGGPEETRLRDGINRMGSKADRVHLVGYVPAAAKSWLLRNAAVVVSNARTEGFGMVPLEAMSVGTPVVSTDGAVQREVCGGAALFIPVDNPDALPQAVSLVLNDSDLAERLIDEGRAQAARFTWTECTTALIRLYRKLSGAP